MPSFKNIALASLALATGALAELKINNWCGDEVHVFVNPGGQGACDEGPGGKCGVPYVIPAGHGGSSILGLPWNRGSTGTSVKVSRASNGYNGILQYEYFIGGNPNGLWWDLSDLDGDGPARTGSPFYHDNVKISPTGNGSGQNTCVQFRCYPGQQCKNAYNQPSDPATHYCPADTGDMWLDLCEPNPQFGQRKRDLEEKNERRTLVVSMGQATNLTVPVTV